MVLSAANPSTPIDLRILGPLNVTVDGKPVSVGGPRQMAVLARLMLTPDQVVTMTQLVESVWDGDEPAQPHVAVRSYISNLRRAIEPNRQRRSTDSCLASSPPGYRLAIDPASIDWVRFERLINDGRQELANGDPAAAVGSLRAANALWTGVPCSGLPESQFFLAHKARLTELRDTGIEVLFEALLAQGDHGSVAAEVESAIAESPLRERLTELGMLAFYRSGRQSEALALGQKLRARLVDDLGVDPSPSIDAIELKILNHDKSLDPETATPRPPIRPGHLPSRSRATNRPGADGPALRAWPTDVLPGDGSPSAVELDRPVGRSSELKLLHGIDTALAAGRSVTAIITGEQGIGKTTLVRSVADDLTRDAVTVAWSRSLAGEDAALWAWAQAIRSLFARHRGLAGLDGTEELAPLAALGPSVATALGLPIRPRPPEWPDRGQDRPSSAFGGPWTSAGRSSGRSKNFDSAEIMLAVTGLLEQLSAKTPIVLIFEDLQWADAGSISLINYAASSLADSPVAFVLTWRETDLPAGTVSAGLRELSRLPALIRLELGGLDSRSIGELASILGRPLTVEETESVNRRSDGNPLFVREMLAEEDLTIDGGRRRSTLVDTVVDRVERLHPDANAVLSAASLFRTPFTLEALAPICDPEIDPETMQEVLNAAVRAGVVREVEPTIGSYGFRQSLVAEVLASGLLGVSRATRHEAIGHFLAKVDGLSFELAHHLSKSRAPEDRLLAARAAIALFNDSTDGHRLAELDDYIRIGGDAVHRVRAVGQDDLDEFTIDASHYLSWRSWVDGRPNEWLDNGRRSLGLALDATTPAGTKTLQRTKSAERGSRTAGPSWRPEGEDGQTRLERAVFNLIGAPVPPVGATRTAGFIELGNDDVAQLTEAAERLGVDSAARWATQVHLGWLQALGRPGAAGQTKALREAMKLVSGAKRRLGPADSATVLRVLLCRFYDTMEPKARLEVLNDIGQLDACHRNKLFITRHAYPALLEVGQTYDAERRTEAMLHETVEHGNPLLLSEARLLWIRHLLWTGQLDAAAEELDHAIADWRGLGLAEPVPMVRQRRTLRLLRREPLGDGHGPDRHHQLLIDRVDQPELALRLARLGDDRRAIECLDRLMETIGVRHVSLADQALIALAAGVVGHEKAALSVLDLLMPNGDRPVVRSDGSMILGPASLYAGLAASAAGREVDAARLVDSGVRAVQRFGGSPTSVDVVIRDLGTGHLSNRLPTNP